MSHRMLFLNGSLRGSFGNSHALLDVARRSLAEDFTAREIVLADYADSVEALAQALTESDALLFATGVYWSSWGSPLQRFFEVMTSYELGACFLGKPAGVLISMDSVGGMDVAQRLSGVLTLLGCMIPPLANVVISRVGAEVDGRAGFEDVYQLSDVATLMGNLMLAARAPKLAWRTWSVAKLPPISGNFPLSGVLERGLARIPFRG